MAGSYGPDLASKVSEWVPSAALMGAMLACPWCLWATVAHQNSRLPGLSFLMGNLKFLPGTTRAEAPPSARRDVPRGCRLAGVIRTWLSTACRVPIHSLQYELEIPFC